MQQRRRTLAATGTFAVLAVTLAGCSTGAKPKPGQTPAPRGGAATARPGTGPSPNTPAGTAAGTGAAGMQAGGPGGAGEPAPKPYAQVITADAKSRAGLFKTHRVKGKLMFEIPARELGKDMLLVTTIAKNTLGRGYGGQNVDNVVLRWERRDNRVLLRGVSYDIVADTGLPIYRAVESANYNPIIATFNVETYGPDSAAVIDVTRLYTNPPTEFSTKNDIRGQVDAARSFLERVASFPENVEVESSITMTVTPTPSFPFGPPPPGVQVPPPVPQTVSVLLHWSMVKLPERPMQARLRDPRVGYFGVQQVDFGRTEQQATTRSFITRYRLECSDRKEGDLCYPKKPITYYVDPATPAWLVPFIKAGIEEWKPAFEAAGFKDGIVAKDAPTLKEDPDWSPEDARYSVIRWLPSEIENAVGPHVHDPRSGEILEADVQMYHNIMNLQTTWYWTQVGHLDPRARKLPLPDSLQGRLVEYVVAHEVGHTLGFPHNMKASSMYPVDSVRNASFVKRMGHTPTLMDYSRFNYVAQPEDNIALADLIPGVGPYDKFATMWGYKPIPDAMTPDAEKPTLDRWAQEQLTKPWLRYMTPGAGGADPGELTEAVGDADAVRATTLGLKNIRRLAPMVLEAATTTGEDYGEVAELYSRLLGQWATELRHVAAIVGGVSSQAKVGGQDGVLFEPIGRARQKDAVRFLGENAFRTPTFMLDPQILRRIEPDGAIARVNRAQAGVLNTLLADDRLERLVEFDALNDRDVYPLAEMLADVRRGVWTELSGTVKIDAFRRQLQRSYLQNLNTKLNPTGAPTPRVVFTQLGQVSFRQPLAQTDIRAAARGELKALDAQIRTALPRATDTATRLHLEDMRNEIDKILDPMGRN